nr:LOW QUALITY PROTEIN: achaete-scute complex protein T3-like [Cherax quadricarinatus]
MIPGAKRFRLDHSVALRDTDPPLGSQFIDRNNNNGIVCSKHRNDNDLHHTGNPDKDSSDFTSCQNVNSNNKAGVSGLKYQLRPRSIKVRHCYDSEWSFQDTLRHKPRPPPLSRYRRKTANARERYRMRQINTAFDSLRGVLPSWVCSRRASSDLTKITTLKLASAYIRSLQDILDGNAQQDTYSWVLSSIFSDAPSPEQPQSVHHYNPSTFPSKAQQQQQQELDSEHPTTDSELVSLLYGASDSCNYQDSLETFSYLSSGPDADSVSLLLGYDSSRVWPQQQHAQLAT